VFSVLKFFSLSARQTANQARMGTRIQMDKRLVQAEKSPTKDLTGRTVAKPIRRDHRIAPRGRHRTRKK
jgi:hypothetical protein